MPRGWQQVDLVDESPENTGDSEKIGENQQQKNRGTLWFQDDFSKIRMILHAVWWFSDLVVPAFYFPPPKKKHINPEHHHWVSIKSHKKKWWISMAPCTSCLPGTCCSSANFEAIKAGRELQDWTALDPQKSAKERSNGTINGGFHKWWLP